MKVFITLFRVHCGHTFAVLPLEELFYLGKRTDSVYPCYGIFLSMPQPICKSNKLSRSFIYSYFLIKNYSDKLKTVELRIMLKISLGNMIICQIHHSGVSSPSVTTFSDSKSSIISTDL